MGWRRRRVFAGEANEPANPLAADAGMVPASRLAESGAAVEAVRQSPVAPEVGAPQVLRAHWMSHHLRPCCPVLVPAPRRPARTNGGRPVRHRVHRVSPSLSPLRLGPCPGRLLDCLEPSRFADQAALTVEGALAAPVVPRRRRVLRLTHPVHFRSPQFPRRRPPVRRSSRVRPCLLPQCRKNDF